MDRRPKMSGREALNPDAIQSSQPHRAQSQTYRGQGQTQRSPGSKSKKGRGRFRDDRRKHPTTATSPRYNGKPDRNIKRYANHHQDHVATALNDPLLKRRDSFGGKKDVKQAPCEVAKKAEPEPTKAAAMGFCGNVGQAVEKAVKTESGEEEPMMVDVTMEEVAGEVSGKSEYGQEIVVRELYRTLKEYLQVEGKFQPSVVLPARPQRGEITSGARDGAAHVLRCLKVWYDLPTDVLFHAINLLDRFLTKMKVRPCHMSCISVSSMNIAIVSHRPQLPPVSTEDLVSISQCKCTVGDVRRMSLVIGEKLGAVGDAITSLQWLRLFTSLFTWVAPHLVPVLMPEGEMVNRLEILACDASCCNIRPCELALALLCTQLDSEVAAVQGSPQQESGSLARLVHFAMELQRICQIGDETFYSSHQAVVGVLERYNARQKTPHRQRLVWRLSSRTLKVLRPTDRLTSMLPTIEEQQQTTSGPSSDASRLRSGSESSDDLSEESKDWPTSPLVPVICNDN